MATRTVRVQAMEDPELEQGLIDEFLRARGLDTNDLHTLPEWELAHVLADASLYASAKLA